MDVDRRLVYRGLHVYGPHVDDVAPRRGATSTGWAVYGLSTSVVF